MLLKNLFTREIKIGLMVLVSGVVLFFGFNYLKGINIFKPTNYYYITFDSINGLVETSPVFIKGHKVGQVSKITSDFSRERAFTVVLDVDKKIKLTQGTLAELSAGLLGGASVNLLYAPFTGKYAEPGDTLPSQLATDIMSKIADGLLPKIDRMVVSADSVITALNTIARSPELKNSLASLENTMQDLETTSASLKTVMKTDVPRIVGNVDVIAADFATVGGNLKQIDFQKTVGSLDYTVSQLNTVAQKMNSREGTLGMLINDPQLYQSLNSTVGSADSLLIDLKANPKNYVHFSLFGKKNKTK